MEIKYYVRAEKKLRAKLDRTLIFRIWENRDLENSQENKLECQLHLNKTGKKKEARLETPGCLFSQRPTTALSDRTF